MAAHPYVTLKGLRLLLRKQIYLRIERHPSTTNCSRMLKFTFIELDHSYSPEIDNLITDFESVCIYASRNTLIAF